MHVCTTIVIPFILVSYSNNAQIRSHPNETNFNLDVLASKYGYPSENHTIVTIDNYILQMERIPAGKGTRAKANRAPVLLVPGILCGSVVFANLGPQRSLAFILADSGYDVWLLNYRGTTFSRKHAFLNAKVDKKEYWNFSFQEIANYDVPAVIDRILSVTKHQSIFYIGHSLGSTDFFALASENPSINKKIKLMMALGPALQISSSKSPFVSLISRSLNYIQRYADSNQFYEFLPSSSQLKHMAKEWCADGSALQGLCLRIYYILGYTPGELDKSNLPVIISTTPAGVSLKTLAHVLQLYQTGRFAKYDYGSEENLIRYGSPASPLYNVSKITTPIALLYGGEDEFVNVADVDSDATMLPSLHSKTLIKNLNHGDLLWGIHAPSMLYSKIVNLMNKFKVV